MSNYLDITINDFDSICRTCLSREDLKPLYEKCSLSECPAEMLMACTFVKFTEDDGLPMKICTNCIYEINQAFSFAKRCETTDTILRKCVNKCKTALEETKIKPEIILPNIHRKVLEVLEDYKVKQEVDVKIEYEEEVKKEEELIIKNEYDENDGDLADKSYEEDLDEDKVETYSEKSDNPVCKFRRSSTNSQKQIHGECSKERNARHSESNDRMYQCQTCDKSFKRRVLLKTHQMIHTVETNDNEYDETYDDPINESYEEYQNGTHSEKFDNRTSRCRSTNFQIEEESSKEKNGTSPTKKLDLLKQKAKLPNQILGRDFKCTICDRAFTEKIILQRHSLIHGEKKFECSVCGTRFRSRTYLNFHSKVHTDVRLYPCDVCRKAFRTLENLKNHKLIHTCEKTHVCSVCSMAFAHHSQLKKHEITHTGVKPYSCEVCNKSFSFSQTLTSHKRIHTGENLHVCSVCSKAFTEIYSLKRHLRIHTGVKPFSCDVCFKSFSSTQNLTTHKRLHTGEKPCICSVCSKAFRYASNVKKHLRTVHAGMKLL